MVPVECGLPPGAVIFPTGVTPRFHEFYDSLDLLLVPSTDTEDSARLRLGGPDCDTNRNRAIRNLPPECRWALFLDDDQVFPRDILVRMLTTMFGFPDIDALTAWYVKKTPPFAPIIFKDAPEDSEIAFDRLTNSDVIELKKQGPIHQIAACGGGMLLVERETLDTIGDPWFSPGPGRKWGGDIGFGKALKDHGLKLWVDLALPVGHAMPTVITPEWDGDKLNYRFSFGDNSFVLPSTAFPDKIHRLNVHE